MLRWRVEVSKEPLHLIFVAGFSYALAAFTVFGAKLTDSAGWWRSFYFLMAVAAVILGWLLTMRAMWFAYAEGKRTWVVSSFALYWLFALLGLLFMAVASDPMPFMSTLVSALVSIMVAWLVGNILREPKPARSRRGWWNHRL